MKLIFLALLAVNTGFFLFQFIGKDVVVQPSLLTAEYRDFGNLQMLSERDAKARRADKVIAKKNETASVSVDAADKCELIGPFAEVLHAEYLIERLVALGVSATIKQVEIADGKNYWVYLRPEMSEKEALRRLSEIQQSKAIDSYIIPSGELANGISFGQFSGENEAKGKAEQVRGQGYPAEIKEIPKSHNETWVEVHHSVGQKLSEDQWLGLLKEEKDIERRQNYCLGVAR